MVGRHADDGVYMAEIGLVGPGRVVFDQGILAVRIGRMQPIKFGERHGLDDVKPLALAVLEKELDLFEGQTMKNLPVGIGQPEKRLAALRDQETVVLTYCNARQS